MKSSSGEVIFILAPRHVSLVHVGKKSLSDVDLLETLINRSVHTNRSSHRIMFTSSKVVDVGYKSQRGGPGIELSRILKEDGELYDLFQNFCCRMEMVTSQLLPHHLLSRLNYIRSNVVQYPTILTDTGIYSASSTSKNYISAAHTDPDFFFSTLTLRCAINQSDDWNSFHHSPPAHHFIFPTIGAAVALRPGDHLIFNPSYHHCCSMKLRAYSSMDVYVSTLYLKTAVVGGNNNSLPLTPIQANLTSQL
jgi:hypothetical protein